MVNHSTSIKINDKLKEEIMTTCKELYLKAHPEMRKIEKKITVNFMLNELKEYYIP